MTNSNTILMTGITARPAPAATLRRGVALLVLAVVGGCQTVPRPIPAAVVAAAEPTRSSAWHAVASPPDEARLTRLPEAWSSGLGEARNEAGGRESIREEGALLDPKVALARPDPTPGSYNCRQVTLGRVGGKGPRFEKFKPFFCYVEVDGDQLTIVKQTGSKRPAGRLWDDDDTRRMIFLGSLAIGNEEEARAYGEDPKRDVAGVFQRIGPFRWRLVLPYPQDGARLNVIELSPVADQPKA